MKIDCPITIQGSPVSSSLSLAEQEKRIRQNTATQLRKLKQFVLWKNKIPYQLNGHKAKTNDKSTWADFDDCLKRFLSGGYDGIGFVFAEGDGLTGIDLDDCFAIDGSLLHWAQEVLDHFPGTYVERSPSGNGLHIFCLGDPVRTGSKKWTIETGKKTGLEVYNYKSARYFTLTGDIETQAEISDGQTGLYWLHQKYFFEPIREQTPSYSSDASKEEVIRALNYISPDEYKIWLETGMACHNAGLPCEVWSDWSKGSPKYKKDDCEKKWRSFGPGSITIASIFYHAKKNGFKFQNNGNASKSSNHAEAGLEWGEPETLKPSVVLEAPEMSSDMVPEALRPYVDDQCERLNVAKECFSVPLMVILGAIVAPRCGIRPKAFDDWTVPPNIWGGLIAPPGSHKSACLSKVTSFLQHLQEKARSEFLEALDIYKLEFEVHKLEVEKIKSEFKRGNKKMSAGALRSALATLPEPKEPKELRYSTNECTIQKLTEIQSGNHGRGLLIIRDELTGFMASLEQKGHESDKAYYNEAWNASTSYTDDKIGRGSTWVKINCVSILGGIQPEPLKALFLKHLKNGANDGYMQRFQALVFPKDRKQIYVDRAPDKEAERKVQLIFNSLDSMDFTNLGAAQDSPEAIPYFRFAPDAQDYFKNWQTLLFKTIGEETNPIIKEHLSKFPKLFASLALLFHLIDIADAVVKDCSQGISYGSARRADQWCQLLEQHARKAYSLLDSANNQAVTELANRIKNGALEDGFSIRDVARKQWRHLTESAVIVFAVTELVELNWLKEETTPGSFQHRSKTFYRINPRLRA